MQHCELGTSARAYCSRKSLSSTAVDSTGSTDSDFFHVIRSVGEECQTEAELRRVVQKKRFNLYDGFEPSGRMHIAQGIFKAVNVNKCTSGGNSTFIFWVADWFGLMNDKMGGDLEKIKTVGKYFITVWKAAGMDIKNCEFRWTSEEITRQAAQYWPQTLDISRVFTISRIKKCCTIMGRSENTLSCAQILYPIMQCADIFFLKADVCQLGVDQRKVNMLAREYCDAVGRKEKPVVLSHHMLLGLKHGQAKMSKSDPDSAIFMEDDAENVRRKITNAYCPKVAATTGAAFDELHLIKDDLANPCLDYVRYILLSPVGATFVSGGRTYTTIEDVRNDFLADTLSEKDLKDSIIRDINKLLDPVRRHFKENVEARTLLATIEQYKTDTTTKKSELKRAQAVDGAARVVFAPRASHDVSVDAVLRLLQGLAPNSILWISDWSDLSHNKMNGNAKAIGAYYAVLLSALNALAPALMKSVKVIRQSEVVEKYPSEYWISAINAGRVMHLNDVQEAIQGEVEAASQVITFLMHVADMLALSAHQLEVVCVEEEKHLHLRAQKYLESVGVKCAVTVMPWTHLSLQKDSTNELFVSEAESAVNSKLKKSFMESCNVDFCPMLNLLRAFHRGTAIPFSLRLKRKPENGGDVEYDSLDTLARQFEDGSLHPGDFKGNAQQHLNALLEPVRTALDKKDVKTLEQARKK